MFFMLWGEKKTFMSCLPPSHFMNNIQLSVIFGFTKSQSKPDKLKGKVQHFEKLRICFRADSQMRRSVSLSYPSENMKLQPGDLAQVSTLKAGGNSQLGLVKVFFKLRLPAPLNVSKYLVLLLGVSCGTISWPGAGSDWQSGNSGKVCNAIALEKKIVGKEYSTCRTQHN